jgi:hypothetical protein
MIRGRASTLVVLALALAQLAVPASSSLADGVSAQQAILQLDQLSGAPRPTRDPLDLAVRFRGLSPSTPLVATPAPTPLVSGETDTFWILDQANAQLFQAAASLELITDHAYWFVESDMQDRVRADDLERSAAVFESQTYPMLHEYFGSEPRPGVDGSGHVLFLLANVPGAAAYFSSADAYPVAVNPRSNQRDMIYVNLNVLPPGQDQFDATITHEMQHMANFARCVGQEGWVDEGDSELAMRVNGYPGTPPVAFAQHPDIQLNAWSQQPNDQTRHYQASYLFVRYVAERAGGWNALPDLLGTCARGEDLFSAFLNRDPIAPDVPSLFSDWTVANLLQDPSAGDGRFAYGGGSVPRVALTGRLEPGTRFLGSIPQYAANYVELPRGGGSVTFGGDATVPLLSAPLDDQSRGIWWSNRGDSMDTSLTRPVDLRGVGTATLRFSAWYDLEDRFDFTYLSASSDGGRTWQVLPGQHTMADTSTGNTYGPGWTGSTGGDWVDEAVDLSAFAGSQILLRFDYVTDQSYNGEGFAFKDVRLPEIGLDEPGADQASWSANGWLRVDAPVAERWNLRLVRWTASVVAVDPVAVDAWGNATIPLDAAAIRTVLVIAPTAPRSLVPADYSLAIAAN